MRSLAYFVLAAFIPGTLPAADPLDEWRKRSEQEQPKRYEGSLLALASFPAWEILSFGGETPRFPPKSILHVAFPLPPEKSAIVVAKELETVKYYRMESPPIEEPQDDGWGWFRNWPSETSIDELGVEQDNLGVVAYLDLAEATTPYLSPAYLLVGGEPEVGEAYVAWIRSDSPLRNLQVVCESSRGAKVEIPAPKRVGGRQPFEIKIPHKKLTEGKWKVVVSGQYSMEQGGPGPFVFYFDHAAALR